MRKESPYLGIIEGFFGKSWSWTERSGYAPFLAAHGYSFYVYAPKEDAFLRRRWSEPLPEATVASLASLRATYRGHNLEFGVGLSPFEAYRDYDTSIRNALQTKVRMLNDLSLDLLCVLFDDMRGDLPKLAETQIRILGDIREVSTAPRIVFCPTYYSYDPIIKRVFGDMPDGYLEDLGRGLDSSIDLFWTGERVCSTEYSVNHLTEIAERLRRKPFLWDNYPVNDSKKASPFVYLRPFENRGPHLASLLSGHAVNPMKQPWLSRIPLASLSLNYRASENYDTKAVFKACVEQVCSSEIAGFLMEDLPLFHDIGLASLSEEQRAYLRARYDGRGADPFCREILLWLQGSYEFDPACLTE